MHVWGIKTMIRVKPISAKSCFLAVLAGAAIFAGCRCYEFWRSAKISESALSMIVRRDAGIPIQDPISPRRAAFKVRDWIYRNFKPGPEMPNLAPSQVYAVLGSDKDDMLCDGASRAYQWALRAIGIPARVTYLAGSRFLAGKDLYQAHATVEIFVDGDWEISDPTFNTSFVCKGKTEFLSVPEAAECLQSGFKLVSVPGKTQIAQRTIASYYEPFENFFAAWKRFDISADEVSEPKEEFPQHRWFEEMMKKYDAEAKAGQTSNKS